MSSWNILWIGVQIGKTHLNKFFETSIILFTEAVFLVVFSQFDTTYSVANVTFPNSYAYIA